MNYIVLNDLFVLIRRNLVKICNVLNLIFTPTPLTQASSKNKMTVTAISEKLYF